MDVFTLRLVVASLCAICCICISGITVASCFGHEVPPTLGSIASMAAGALVGILVTPSPGIQKINHTSEQCNNKQ
jgi:hypothetical protein